MNKRPYNNLIERKLEQLPGADADLLWNDMHSILDKKMPQKKERRRVVGWISSSKSLLLMCVVLFIIIGSSLYFLPVKEDSSVASNKSSGSKQPNKLNESGTPKISQANKENLKTGNEVNLKTIDKIDNIDNKSITPPLGNAVGYVINNNSVAKQKFKRSEEYTLEDQFNLNQLLDQLTEDFSKTRDNSEISLVIFNSINQDLFIGTNNFKENISIPANKGNTNNRDNNESGFYAGIISGVDLSSIHFQNAKTGASKGFIIGFALNKNWSLESGLLWDTKRVYDNGTYFNPPGYTPTSGITITAVNGKSRLYELPVNVKYTIKSGDHNFFATSGLSSYFMRAENYDYEYTQNNQPGGHNYLSYKNETKNWFGVANFSLGYAHKIGSNGSIRIEPYLKVPIKNIGIGNMPITSTGLNIGFIKTLR